MGVPLSPLELLERAWRGETVGADDARRFVESWLGNGAPDAQMAAWCAIAQVRGFPREATAGVMAALIASGERLDLAPLGMTGDVHSTGGVGDNATLVAVPIAAALGVRVAKMSRRGLGHWGGTVDKLEAIPGYRTELELGEFVGQVQRVGCAVIAQNPRLVPADARLTSLRETIGAVANPDLVAASVMAKALAGGAEAVALEVTWGNGAACASRQEAESTADLMSWLAAGWGRRTRTTIAASDGPLGHMIGNALEVAEAADVLRGGGPADLRDVAVRLAGHLAEAAGVVAEGHGADRARAALADGAALASAEAWIVAQGGNPGVLIDGDGLPAAPIVVPVITTHTGTVAAIDARRIGDAVRRLGAGRLHPAQQVDHAVGAQLLAKRGALVDVGEPIAMVHARDQWLADHTVDEVLASYNVDTDATHAS